MRNTVLEVSRKAFLNNYKKVLKYIDNKALVMPVVKANAYGTYLNRDLELMNKFDIIAVAIVDEAIELRKIGYKKDIFILNQPYSDEIEAIEEYDLIVGISSKEFLKEVIKRKKSIRCHIELETGMGRCGVLSNDLEEFLKLLVKSDIKVEGVYSHLSSADMDHEFTMKQLKLFEDGVLKVKEVFPDIKYIHCEASSGLLNFDLGICNVVRPGILLYGYQASKSSNLKISLDPVAKLKSKISYIKKVKPGDSISYGRSFVADREMTVATVGCGYADGVRRELSNKGMVAVNGHLCKILGKVCMDSFMIDVSDISNVKVNDEVYLFDNKLVTVDEIAYLCETINYEILATIGERVPRIFVD